MTSIENARIGSAIAIDDTYDTLAARYARAADPNPLATLLDAVRKGAVHAPGSSTLMPPGFIAGLIAIGGQGDTIEETKYIVRRTELGDEGSYVLEPIYVATWTLSATNVADGAGTLEDTYQECDLVSVASTNLLEARVGVGPEASTGEPVSIEIPDLGPGVEAVVSIFRSESVTTVRPIATRWR